jgi:hypothetical protein
MTSIDEIQQSKEGNVVTSKKIVHIPSPGLLQLPEEVTARSTYRIQTPDFGISNNGRYNQYDLDVWRFRA